MGQLLNLICLLNHINRQNIFIRLIHLLFQIGRQRQQLICVRHQPLLPLRAPSLFLLLQPMRISQWIQVSRLTHLTRKMLPLLKLSPTHIS